MKIEKLREKINGVDDQILELLNTRADIVKEIGKSKVKNSLNFYDPAREERILTRLQKKNKGSFPNASIVAVFREIISASLSLEKPLKIFYLGPEATFTHIAALKKFGFAATLNSMISLKQIFSALERDQADYGVVPLENSIEGVASHTLDLFIDSELKIFTEIILKIKHDLLALHTDFSKISKIYAHPHSLLQCSEWIREHWKNKSIVEVSNTSQAISQVSRDPSTALIAEETIGGIYNLHTVCKRIEDTTRNFARFLVLKKTWSPVTKEDQTSILFSMKNQVGALSLLLQPFVHHQISLLRIESRPVPNRPWECVFLVDFDGHIEEIRVKEALEELKIHCDFLKILGSYPKSKINFD